MSCVCVSVCVSPTVSASKQGSLSGGSGQICPGQVPGLSLSLMSRD